MRGVIQAIVVVSLLLGAGCATESKEQRTQRSNHDFAVKQFGERREACFKGRVTGGDPDALTVNAKDGTPSMVSASCIQSAMQRLQLKEFAGWTPYLLVAQPDRADGVRLMERGIDVLSESAANGNTNDSFQLERVLDSAEELSDPELKTYAQKRRAELTAVFEANHKKGVAEEEVKQQEYRARCRTGDADACTSVTTSGDDEGLKSYVLLMTEAWRRARGSQRAEIEKLLRGELLHASAVNPVRPDLAAVACHAGSPLGCEVACNAKIDSACRDWCQFGGTDGCRRVCKTGDRDACRKVAAAQRKEEEDREDERDTDARIRAQEATDQEREERREEARERREGERQERQAAEEAAEKERRQEANQQFIDSMKAQRQSWDQAHQAAQDAADAAALRKHQQRAEEEERAHQARQQRAEEAERARQAREQERAQEDERARKVREEQRAQEEERTRKGREQATASQPPTATPSNDSSGDAWTARCGSICAAWNACSRAYNACYRPCEKLDGLKAQSKCSHDCNLELRACQQSGPGPHVCGSGMYTSSAGCCSCGM